VAIRDAAIADSKCRRTPGSLIEVDFMIIEGKTDSGRSPNRSSVLALETRDSTLPKRVTDF